MKTPKITISLPCLALLLATLATTPALHGSQTSAQTSAKSSSTTSHVFGAIQSRSTLSTQSILKLAYEGEIYYQQEKFDDAIIHYQKVYDQTKNNAQFINIHLDAAHRLGVISFENKEWDKASSYFQEIVTFKESYNNLPVLIDAFKGLGCICYRNDNFSEAFDYFAEAYLLRKPLILKNIISHPSKRISRQDPAYFLGRMYKDGQGISVDREQAFFFLKESYKAQSPYIHPWAALELGLLYCYWYFSSKNYRNNKDIKAIQKYLNEAYFGARSFFSVDVCPLIEFRERIIKIFLIQQGEDLLEKIKGNYNPKLALKAQRYFNQAKQFTCIPNELNIPLEQEIKEKEQELVTLKTAFTQNTFQETRLEITPQEAAENQKNIVHQEKLLKDILQELEIRFKAYQKRPSDAREQEVEFLLNEARKLTKNPEVRDSIQQKFAILGKHTPQQEISGTIPINNETERATWLILDPFGEIPKETSQSPSLKRHLYQLKTDYLELPGAIKLHGFINLWRVRAGNDRIIYTVIPQSHRIGIIKIDARKDVYAAPEESRNREEFFQNTTSSDFLQQISSQHSSTDSKESKE